MLVAGQDRKTKPRQGGERMVVGQRMLQREAEGGAAVEPYPERILVN